jgi:Leucine-rich repeat (LRR) protein
MNTILLSAITLLLGINLSLSAEVCPPAADIAPCTCVMDTFNTDGRSLPSIKCVGPQIKDLNLIFGAKLVSETRSPRLFSALFLNGTDIGTIAEGTFGDAVFYNIFIGNNMKLTHISPNAFKNGNHAQNHLHTVDFYNNPLLGATNLADLFKLIENLQVLHTLDITQCGLTEIPDNAFSMNTHIEQIYIQHNPSLKRVGKFAFAFLPNLKDVTFQSNNLLSVIDAHAFEFSSINHVQLDLAFNQLTEAAFSPLSFGTAGKAPNEVLLYANQLKSVPEAVFRQHMGGEKGIHRLLLGQNPIVCDCKTKWLLDDNLSTRVPSVICANIDNRNLFTIEPMELPKCTL